MARKSVDFDTVREIARTLPGVVESMSSRGRSFKVRGKMLACKATNRSAEEGSLVVRLGLAERAKRLVADPDVYYVTPHYEGYPCVLVRLGRITPEALGEVLEAARRFATSGASTSPAGLRASRPSRKRH